MKKYLLIIYISLMAFWLLIPTSWATTYYVCKLNTDCNAGAGSGWSTGDDGNNGTAKATPWATVQKAADTMTAGDTVIVGDGTYTDWTLHNSQQINLYIYNTNGSNGNPITYQAENKWGAVLEGDAAYGTGSVGVRIYRSSWIVVDGFEVKDDYWFGIDLLTYSSTDTHDIVIKNCKIHNIGRHAATAGNYISGRAGIYSDGSTRDITVDRNVIYDVGRTLDSAGNAWDFYIHDHGFYAVGFGHIFTNNIVYNIYGGYHVSIRGYNGSSESGSSIIISNNVFAYAVNPFSYYGDGGVLNTYWDGQTNQCQDVIVQNNVVYEPSAGSFIRTRDQAGYYCSGTNVLRNNVGDWDNLFRYDQGANRWQTVANNTQLSNAALAAQMTDPENQDFTLVAAASNLIDSGYATSAPDHDFDNVSRPINAVYDIGAYERQSGPILSGLSPISLQSCGYSGQFSVTSDLNSNLRIKAGSSCSGQTYASISDGTQFTGGEGGTSHTVTVTNTCGTSTDYIIIGEDSSTGEDSNCLEATMNIAAAGGSGDQPVPAGMIGSSNPVMSLDQTGTPVVGIQ